MAAAGRLMVIFSAGGLGLTAHGTAGTLRCQPAVVSTGGVPDIVLDPFPGPGGTGVVRDGRAALLRGEAEADGRPLTPARPRGRWDDLDVLCFAATTLFAWIVLPTALDHPAVEVRELGPGPSGPSGGLRRVEVTVPAGWAAVAAGRHVLHLDAAGRVRRHEDGPVVHELTGHCDFGGTMVATRRRTRVRAGGGWFPIQWADLVAAHAIPDGAPNSSTKGADLPTTPE